MLGMMQAYVDMMSEYIKQLLAVRKEVDKIIGKKI